MRVLQLFNRYRERGGEEKSVARIFSHLEDLCEIDRIWWDSRDWDGSDGPGKLGQLGRLFHNPDSAAELRKKIEEFRPEVLLCHNLYPVGSPAVYREAARAKIPIVQFVHNFRPFSVGGSLWLGDRIAEESLSLKFRGEILAGAWQDSILKSAIFALVLKNLHWSGLLDTVKKWVCISDFMAEQFLRAGVPKGRVSSLRHSWDAKQDRPPSEDQGYYLFLSRLVEEKGVKVLLEAWKLLENELGEATPKLRIGGTGPEEEMVKVACQSGKIEFLGFVDGDEKERQIEGCRAMLAPSVWWEPLGLVTYEAYDFSKPMMAAASGGLSETVEHGVTGLLCRPNDPEALKMIVLEMEGMLPESRVEMGLRGREKLLKEASPEQWKVAFLKILEEVVENHRGE